jgi:hypothetical protein
MSILDKVFWKIRNPTHPKGSDTDTPAPASAPKSASSNSSPAPAPRPTGTNEMFNVLSTGLRYITSVSPDRLTETQPRLSTAVLLFACYGYTEFDPTGLKHSGHEAILRALAKGVSFTHKCLQLGLIDDSLPISVAYQRANDGNKGYKDSLRFVIHHPSKIGLVKSLLRYEANLIPRRQTLVALCSK